MIADPALTGQFADRLTRRVPTALLTIGPTVVVVLTMATLWTEPAGYFADVEEATAWGTFLLGIPIGAAWCTVLMAWWAPRLGSWVLALSLLSLLIDDLDLARADGMSASGAIRDLIGIAWLTVVVVDLVLVIRQRSSTDEVSRLDPTPSGPTRWRADHHRGVRLIAAVLLVTAIGVGFGGYLGWRGDVRDLADRAVPVETTVIGADSSDDTIVVRLDGEELELYVNDSDQHPVGSGYTVFTDPTGEMSPYGEEDVDPSGWAEMGIPIGAGMALLGFIGPEFTRRRRRVEHLASSGEVGMRALVRWHPEHNGLDVFAIDDTAAARPIVFLPAVEPLQPLERDEPGGLRGAVKDLVETGKVLVGWRDPEETPDWAGREDDDLELDEESQEDWDHDRASGLHEVRVIGLLSDGSLCVVRMREGGEDFVLAALRPARDRWTVRTWWGRAADWVLDSPPVERVLGGAPTHPSADGPDGGRSRSHDEYGPSRWDRLRHTLGNRTAVLSAPALTLLGVFLVPWLLEEEGIDLGAIAVSFLAAHLAAWWWDVGRPLVVPSRWGLRATRPWFDDLILPGEISDVHRTGDEVVLHLENGDRVFFGPHLGRSPAAAEQDLDQVATLVDQARSRADQLDEWPERWPLRVPSSSTLAGLVVLATWLASAFLA